MVASLRELKKSTSALARSHICPSVLLYVPNNEMYKNHGGLAKWVEEVHERFALLSHPSDYDPEEDGENHQSQNVHSRRRGQLGVIYLLFLYGRDRRYWHKSMWLNHIFPIA